MGKIALDLIYPHTYLTEILRWHKYGWYNEETEMGKGIQDDKDVDNGMEVLLSLAFYCPEYGQI